VDVRAALSRPAGDGPQGPQGRGRQALLAVGGALALAGCARQAATAVAPDAPGFLLGLWHGFIFPAAWTVSLFWSDVAIYAVPNDGGWYDFGYFLGIVVFGVGARKSRVIYKDRTINVRAKRVEEVGP
jgi:hypothetical protein